MTDLIERLRNFEGSDDLGNGDFSLLHEAADALESERKDAARYRWLKKSAFCNVWARGDGIALVVPRTPAANIDSKIDAEMAMESSND